MWKNPRIPRASFILWLAIHEKLPTQDVLIKKGIINTMSCYLCRAKEESVDHLFFKCLYTRRVWQALMSKLGVNWQARGWLETVEQMIKVTKGKGLKARMLRLVFNATVYGIWKERNARWSTNTYLDAVTTIRGISQMVSLRVMNVKGCRRSLQNMYLQREWALPDSIFDNP